MPNPSIIGPLNVNVDEAIVSSGAVISQDCYIDELGALNRRPGLWRYWLTGDMADVDGVYWWREKHILIIVCMGRVWAMMQKDTQPVELSTPEFRMVIGNNVSFAASNNTLLMANGAEMYLWLGDPSVAIQKVADPSLPPKVSCVCFIEARFLALEADSPRVYITEGLLIANTTPVWKPTFFTMANSNENIIWIAANYGVNELLLIAQHSSEPWYFTGVESGPQDVPFAPIGGAGSTRGCAARGSPVLAANTWFWLDHERKVIQIEGRSPTIVSWAIDRVLQTYDRVDDAIGSWYGPRWYILSFPTQRVTWVYDIMSKGWHSWGFWNHETGNYDNWLGKQVVYADAWNYWIVAGRDSGRIYIADKRLQADDFQSIRMHYRSGHLHYGTMKRKFCKELRIELKRGI